MGLSRPELLAVQLPDSCHATATYNCSRGYILYVIGGNGTMYSFESRMHGKPITDNFEPIEDIKAGKVRSIKCFPSEECSCHNGIGQSAYR